MAAIPYNPFTNRSMITKEDEFVGRETEISNILSRVRNGDSVSVVGDRRIGKSSLLYHLFLTGNRRLKDTNAAKYKFIYLDLTNAQCSSIQGFCQQIIKNAGGQPRKYENPTDKALMIELAEFLDELNFLPVLLLDEFEKCTQSGHFNDDFFNHLRSLVNAHKLSFVTASHHTLKELTEKGGLTSPFWNVFLNQQLGEFIVSDVVDEVTLFIEHFWLKNLKPSSDEFAFLVSYCGRHPLYMQVVSYWVLKNRELGYNEIALKEEIDQELSGYFRDKQELLKKWLKREIPKNFKRIIWSVDEIGKMIKALSPLAMDFKPDHK